MTNLIQVVTEMYLFREVLVISKPILNQSKKIDQVVSSFHPK